MDDYTTKLRDELNDAGSPLHDAYVNAGWEDPLPTMGGDPTVMKTVPGTTIGLESEADVLVHANPFTQADNDARFAQGVKYTAIASILNNTVDGQDHSQPLPGALVSAKQFTDALDQGEWNALTQAQRDYLGMLQRAGSTNWMAECLTMFEAASTTDTKDALAALTCSRAKEQGLPRTKAGHVKHARGDTI